jgi:hypothetical protein
MGILYLLLPTGDNKDLRPEAEGHILDVANETPNLNPLDF